MEATQTDVRIEACKENAVRAMKHFLHAMSFVPDDKLHWSPVPSSKSAFKIAAHTAVTNGNFAKMIRERRLPSGDEIAEFVARTQASEASLTTREEIEALFRKNTDDVLAAIDTLSPDEFELILDTGVGFSMPMKQLMNLPTAHVNWHIGQIDYLQTCWDDQEVHF